MPCGIEKHGLNHCQRNPGTNHKTFIEVGCKLAGIEIEALVFQLVAQLLAIIEIELAGGHLVNISFNLK